MFTELRYTPDISKKPRPVSEADVCRYLGNNLDPLKEQAKKYICQEIDALSREELFDRFWQGRVRYGGPFDVDKIPVREELFREAQDVLWYIAFMLHQGE